MDTQQDAQPLAFRPVGDHDAPYTFGRRPNVSHPYPFSIREYARLLVLRSRYRDGLVEPSEDLPLAA
ncbi:MAG: hypothetical protein JO023_16790 [Chloroflexi bacterium]|nr:hypothetical protein [Chloroflexota bacterium]